MGNFYEKLGGTYLIILSFVVLIDLLNHIFLIFNSDLVAKSLGKTYLFYFFIGILISIFSVFLGFKILKGKKWAKISSFIPLLISVIITNTLFSFLGIFYLLIPLLGILFIALSLKEN